MASFWQKTLFYLGLVDEEGGYSSGDDRSATVGTTDPGPIKARPPGTIAGRRVDPPASYQRRSANWEHTEAGVYVQPDSGRSSYDPMGMTSQPQTEVITARNFSDAQLLADGIGNGRAVVLDLRNTEPEMVRRLVDFTSGLTYALNGKMAKIAQGVILVSPAGVTVGDDELNRLASAGLYSTG
jgi:cell division inhibitor SepF